MFVTQSAAALLASSIDKLNAREKELVDSKQFLEGKRDVRLKDIAQLEDSLKSDRSHPSLSPVF